MKRGSGILLHISSLPGNYGIGTMGAEAFRFVDFLCDSKQTYWQVLPLGHTIYRDSPYQCFSSFAGNPYLIDLEVLASQGLLDWADLEKADLGSNCVQINYSKMFYSKMDLLRKAFQNGYDKYSKEVELFKLEKFWLRDYSLFMALKVFFNYLPWQQWEDPIKYRLPETIKYYEEALEQEIAYWDFIQFVFYEQWSSLKEYANSAGIQIIGDIPFYVPEDSVDYWVNRNLFVLDSSGNPLALSGVPGDKFSEDGQLWGTPIYNWKVMEENGFDWWIDRIRGSLAIFDVIRLDHFIGFHSFWSIPFGSLAKNGTWQEGPGIKLFHAIESELGKVPIIAEDLGPPMKGANNLKRLTGYPGMNILLFAFDSDSNNNHLPHNYCRNSVVYTGTHDNATVLQWLDTVPDKKTAYAINYLNLNDMEEYHWGFIRAAWGSVSNVSIAPMQDILGLGAQARMNTPSTMEGNWQWRIKSYQSYEKVTEKLSKLTMLYGRD